MARLVVELTNRCNLRCAHCYPERHAASGDLPMAIVESAAREASACGIDHFCLSGGEPTLHRHFGAVVERVTAAGCTFSVVTNGRDCGRVTQVFARHRDRFRGVTFSLDGAREATHDASRGTGSYRQVMRAATLCYFKDLPFTFNMVLTAWNRREVPEMIDLAAALGSRGVRFGHLMFTHETIARGLNLSPGERRDVEDQIRALACDAPVAVDIAPGYFSESPFFPCAPPELEEYNLDYRGCLTLCCHLSGFAGPNGRGDVIGSLEEMSLPQACERARARVATYLADKRAYVGRGAFGELDHFPCWYCVKYLGKAPHSAGAAWEAPLPPPPPGRRLHVIAPHAAPRP